MGARKNARETRDGVLPLPSRVSLARPVLSSFLAPVTSKRLLRRLGSRLICEFVV